MFLAGFSWFFPAPPKAGLDLDAFPHILDAVLDSADMPALLALRQTCRGMQELVDARFAHLVAGPDGSLRAVPSGTDRTSTVTEKDDDDVSGLDVGPMIDAYRRSAARGGSFFSLLKRKQKVKPFIFAAARQIDRYHCPGKADPESAAPPITPCSGEGEDGCACSCAPVPGLVHFNRLEVVREWRCPAPEVDNSDEEDEMDGARTPSASVRWSLDEQLSKYVRPPIVAQTW